MELRSVARNCFQLYCKHINTERILNSSFRLIERNYSSESTTSLEREVVPLPKQARVVICGGGILGSSIAYHLSERGWTDVVLLEQGSLTCGTTWHSAGLVGQLRSNTTEMKIVQYSRNLYARLEEEGHGLGWKGCSSMMLARTSDRMIDFQRKHAISSATGFETHILTQKEVKEKNPLIKYDDLKGGLWIPSDGVVTAPDVAITLSKLAKNRGVTFLEGVKVENILTQNARVASIETSAGTINCEYFVNCAGLWSRELGFKSVPRVDIPLHSCEHYYVVSKPLENIDRMLPVTRDYDGYVYAREWNGGLLAGGFEPVSKPCFHSGIPDKFEFQLLQEDWNHFQILMEQILYRFPLMQNAEIRQLLNGPESFTMDSNWVLGETPQIGNYYVAAGMNSRGIAGGGGIGKYMAEWIIDGEPSIDMWPYDIRRFVKEQNCNQFLKERVTEVLGTQYSLQYPQKEYKSGRKLRTSLLHTRLEEEGAVFGAIMAYERPLWFDPKNKSSAECNRFDERGEDVYLHEGSYDKPSWFELAQDEYWACKERVCLIDMSSFAKFEIKSAGNEAVNFLQYLCSNNIDLETGSIIHTGMQNHFGGYKNDCRIARLGKNSFFMICPATQQIRALSWLHRNLPVDGSVQVRDVTSMFAGINLIGPHAQQLLADVSGVDTTNNNFGSMTCQFIDVGHASGIRAMRLTHAGEDGFILYIPSEYALHVYDTLMNAGRDYGVRNAGYYAIRHLGIEKSFAYWDLDLDAHTTPLECGLDSQVDFTKDNFIGKGVLSKQKIKGIDKTSVQLTLNDFDVNKDIWPWGGEPIYRNGKYVGKTSTCGYGFTLARMICLGFVSDFDENGQLKINSNMNDYVMDKNAVYEIDIAGKKFSARIIS